MSANLAARLEPEDVSSTHEYENDMDNLLAWLEGIKNRRGRPLRVLHVGNIAANGYLNAKFLRSVGVEAHVLSYDYNHVMAMPEWEDVELLDDHGDDFQPEFSKRDLVNYERPDWFVSGPLLSCPSQIAVLCGDQPNWWRRAVWSVAAPVGATATKLFGTRVGYLLETLVYEPRMAFGRVLRIVRRRLKLGRLLDKLPRLQKLIRDMRRRRSEQDPLEPSRQLVIEEFDRVFPDRQDRLRHADFSPFLCSVETFRKMFKYYDVVQCYSTDPIHALLSEKRPYVAFEHGTLRTFTMGDDPLHRLTALAYRQADHTFITNGDCLEYAERLGIENYAPMIHPIDVDQHRTDFGDAIGELRREIDADVILFCPLRHDWDVKGTDIHLRAFPLIKARLRDRRIKLVLTSWGNQLADSRALLESLGVANDVIWKKTMCRISTIKYMQAADVVLDQMALPPFGATAPQAIAAGTPVISSYVPESTRWIIPEPAPILPAFSPEEVATAVIRAIDPDWRENYRERARRWTDTYHHPNNVIRGHLAIYRKIFKHSEASSQD